MTPSKPVLSALAKHTAKPAQAPRRGWTYVSDECFDEALKVLRNAGIRIDLVLRGGWQRAIVLSDHPQLPEAPVGAPVAQVRVLFEKKADGTVLLAEIQTAP